MLKIEKPVVDAKDLALWFEGELNKIIQHGEVAVEYNPQIYAIKIGVIVNVNNDVSVYYKSLYGSEIDAILHPNKYSEYQVCNGDELARRHVTAIVNGFKSYLSEYFVKNINDRYEETGEVLI